MTKNEFNLLYSIKKYGLISFRKLAEYANVSTGYISTTLKLFEEKGWIDNYGVTEKGLVELSPYKVDNAILMAAGISSRFVPISIEKPKGLLIVKNEVLIERQIEQLQEAGIKKIILVLGYKKEAFFYLENKFEGIKIIINPEFNKKNNTHTLYLAQKDIRNSYICSSDDYFIENPFEEYVYNSYYASVHVHQKSNEWYMVPDKKMNIRRVDKSGLDGYIMLGHAYWNAEFSEKFIELLNEDYEVGNYSQVLWEQMLADNLKRLPPMEIKTYKENVMFEFDSLDELREFDNNYVKNTHSKIMRNITKVLNCEESDIVNFKAINEGLTNISFVFEVHGKRYVYRHPGEGTQAIISREHEKKALKLASKYKIDPTYVYMNDKEGWKISHYIEDARIPSYNSIEDSKRVIKKLKKLHKSNLKVDWSFLPWEEACKIERILLNEKYGIADPEFTVLKNYVEKCYIRTKGDGVEMQLCHCDTYAPNWIIDKKGDAILIDWEYAGNADSGCDVGTYIMDSMWDIEQAKIFIKEYCDKDYNEILLFHYLAYVAILSFYWYVWALYRESCGAILGESLYNWHRMAKTYSDYLVLKYGL